MLEIKLVNDTYSKEIIDLVLNIQQKEFNVPITIEDQPDLMQIEDFYFANGGSFWGAFIRVSLLEPLLWLNLIKKRRQFEKCL